MDIEGRFRAACLCLVEKVPINCSATTVSDYLSRTISSPLLVFRCISELTKTEALEVLACLSLKGLQGIYAAARICATLRQSSAVWEIMPELIKLDCSIRELALLAIAFGKRARYSRDWSNCIQESLKGNDEAVIAMSALLERRDLKKRNAQILDIEGGPIIDWASQEHYAENPSLARELSWCFFATQRQIANEASRPCDCDKIPNREVFEDSDWLHEAEPGNCALNEKYFRMFGLLMRKRVCNIHSDDTDTMTSTKEQTGFAITKSVRKVMFEFACFASACAPILFQGPQGCGKSTIISQLAQATCAGNSVYSSQKNVCFVHMDTASNKEDSSELSDLVGCVVPSPEGGGFHWRFGPIGHAIINGNWLVLENLDCDNRSGNSFTSALVSRLAELRPGDEFNVSSKSEPLRVGIGFRLIATRTLTSSVRCNSEQWAPPGGWEKWRRIAVPALSQDEQLSMLELRFPTVSDCAQRVLRAVSGVREKLVQRGKALDRVPTFREAVRISTRLAVARSNAPQVFTAEVALLETLDVLALWAPDNTLKDHMTGICADAWSLPSNTASVVLNGRNPKIVDAGPVVHLGRTNMFKNLDRQKLDTSRKLILTKHTARTLERIARCVSVGENVLLNGETGTGKTSTLQELARLLGKNLVVINMSRQSDISDLIGGFRPMEVSSQLPDLVNRFEDEFCKHMSSKKNARFLDELHKATRSRGQHGRALRLMGGAIKLIPATVRNSTLKTSTAWNHIDLLVQKLMKLTFPSEGANESSWSKEPEQPPRKRQRSSSDATLSTSSKVEMNKNERNINFEYCDGVLISALRAGDWVLLDEINLAPLEVLDHLITLLDHGSIIVPNEQGENVRAAEGFALFAAMNPPTDFGKRPLSKEIRSRMTEFFIDDVEDMGDIELLVAGRLFQVDCTREDARQLSSHEASIAHDVAKFYLSVRELSRTGAIDDASGKCARFSLRTLSYMLSFVAGLWRHMGSHSSAERRTLYEGACLAFSTPLPRSARPAILKLAQDLILKSYGKKNRLQPLAKEMSLPPSSKSVLVAGFPVETVSLSIGDDIEAKKFIVTPAVRETLIDVCRALVFGTDRVPILLQGPTSAGKTSLVSYLAHLTGNKLVRINNHEHTDLAEYLGCFIANDSGSLVFREGPLVDAARNGHWVVLDELNLAPPEVLESLNRLLDDNREIRIPETGEIVKAHRNFTLFATQNPPGIYAGRKELSRAFRGRFIEIQVDELPDNDLVEIIERRCHLPSSFAKQMVAVMRELQTRRRLSRLFSGKSGFVTARDLFRWGARKPSSREELAVYGFFLLGERARNRLERDVVREVLLAKIGVDMDLLNDATLYRTLFWSDFTKSSSLLSCNDSKVNFTKEAVSLCMKKLQITSTPHMARMITLLMHCALHNEPALLVGPTGTGKTSACNLIAALMNAKLLSVNCHQHTESSDLVGGFRPGRSRAKDAPLFEWADGPLVQAMKAGHCFLIDEINMADDAVVERLNAVLEPGRTLMIPEKGSDNNTVTAHPQFLLFATMNPGGDFGKKELSPALRNRFTEIWIPSASAVEDFLPIIRNRISLNMYKYNNEQQRNVQEAVRRLLVWMSQPYFNGDDISADTARNNVPLLSLRDVTAWSNFIHQATTVCNIHPMVAFAHGARLVFLDGMSVGATTYSEKEAEGKLWQRVLSEVPTELKSEAEKASYEKVNPPFSPVGDSTELKFGPFSLKSNAPGEPRNINVHFSMTAPCTLRNCARVVRAICVLSRPILLEGPPGAGKTSLICALARTINIPLSRINLSESTEMSDLIGCDAPGPNAGQFNFRKGELLRAIENGSWILLDEMNLASQSVLEGLNSLLDHRRSVFVPELATEVVAHPSFRIFAAQNPAREGFGRRGLPKSFLNRFTKVSVESPSEIDLVLIAQATYPKIARDAIERIVQTIIRLKLHFSDTYLNKTAEFGLRQVLRWCALMDTHVAHDSTNADLLDTACVKPDDELCFDIVIEQAMSTVADREAAKRIFGDIFKQPETVLPLKPSIRKIDDSHVRIGWCTARVETHLSLTSLYGYGPTLHEQYSKNLQAMAFAMKHGWPCIVSSTSNLSFDANQSITHLSALFGRNLFTVKGGSFLDVDDLLGGYVQRDFQGEMKRLLRIIRTELNKVLAADLNAGMSLSGTLHESVQNCEQVLLRMEREGAKETGGNDNLELTFADLIRTSQIVSELSVTGLVTQQILVELENCLQYVEGSLHINSNRSAPVFAWQKSELVSAIERGDWVLIENADHCPPSILDRLNPLLEKSYSEGNKEVVYEPVLLPEAPPNSDDSPAFISPHPQFRLFLLVDEVNGSKLSRAVVDRAVSVRLSEVHSLISDCSASDPSASKRAVCSNCCPSLNPSRKSDFGTAVLLKKAGLGGPECVDVRDVSGSLSTGIADFALRYEQSFRSRDISPLYSLKEFPLDYETRIGSDTCFMYKLFEMSFNRYADMADVNVVDCRSALKSRFRALLAVSLSEFYLLGSTSIQDYNARRNLLLSSFSTFHFGVEYDVQHFTSSVVPETPSNGYLERKDICLDPLYGFDSKLPFNFQHSPCANTLLAQSVVFRFEILIISKLFRGWSALLKDFDAQSLDRNSLYVASKRQEILPPEDFRSSSPHAFLASIAARTAQLLVEIAKSFRGIVLASDETLKDWTITNETIWLNLFQTAQRFIMFVRAPCHSLEEAALGICLLREIETLCAMLKLDALIKSDPLFQKIFACLVSLCERRPKFELVRPSLPTPTSEFGFEIERQICQLYRRNRSATIRLDSMIVAQALVSINASSLTSNSKFQLAMERLSSVLRENAFNEVDALTCDLEEGLEFPLWDHVLYSGMESIGFDMWSALQSIAVRPSTEKHRNHLAALGRITLLESSVNPRTSLSIQVAAQRISWLLSTGHPTPNQLFMLINETSSSFLKLVNTKLLQDLSCRGSHYLNGTCIGSDSVTNSLLSYNKAAAMSSRSERYKAVAAASALISGGLNSARKISDTQSKRFILIADSFLDLGLLTEGDSFAINSSFSANDLPEWERIARIICSKVVFSRLVSLKMGHEYKTAIHNVSLVLQDRKFVFENNFVFTYVHGLLWAVLGAIRIEVSASEIDNFLGLDPSVFAKTETAIFTSNVEKSFALETACIATSEIKLGGDDLKSSLPFARSVQENRINHDRMISRRSDIITRPAGFPSFGDFTNAVSRFTNLVSKDSLISKFFMLDVTSMDPGDAAVLRGQLLETVASLYETSCSALEAGGDLGHFRDVGGSLCRGLRETQFGALHLLKALSVRELGLKRSSSLLDELLFFPGAAFSKWPEASTIFPLLNRSDICTSSQACVILYLFFQSWYNKSEAFKTASHGFDYLVKLWKTKMITEEWENETKSSLYIIKEKARVESMPGNSELNRLEDDEEGDFEKNFNTDVEEVDDLVFDAANIMDSKITFSPKQSGRSENPDEPLTSHVLDVSTFWNYHSICFLAPWENNEDFQKQKEKALLRLLYSLGGNLDKMLVSQTDSANCMGIFAACALSSSISNNSHQDMFPDESITTNTYNFYKDGNDAEVSKFRSALNRFITAIEVVQKRFFEDGEHPFLKIVCETAQRSLKTTHLSASLGTLVSVLENLIRKADEWQKLFATKNMSIDDEVRELSKIALRWRRMEVDSWPNLLIGRDELCKKRAHQWFYYLYDSLVGTENIVSESEDWLKLPVSTLDQFLRSSPQGEFEERIKMLRSISWQLCSSDVSCQVKLGRSVQGLCEYYSQFITKVRESLTSSKQPLEKKMKDFSRLSVWHGTESLGASTKMAKGVEKELEYVRLKSHSEKVRRRLHKLCRDVDMVLNVPVFDEISKAIQRSGFSDLTSELVQHSISPVPRKVKNFNDQISYILTTEFQLVENAPLEDRESHAAFPSNSRLAKIHSLSSRMKSLEDCVSNVTRVLKTGSTCSALRETIRARALRLKESDGAVQVKKRAFIELLRALEKAGVSPYDNPSRKAYEQPVFWLGSPSPFTLDETKEVSNSLLYKSGTRLQRLRAVCDGRIRNADITSDESKKMVAFCSDMFTRATLEREGLSDMVKNVNDVTDIAMQMMGYESGFKNSVCPSRKQVQNLAMLSNRIESIRMDVMFSLRLTEDELRKAEKISILDPRVLKTTKYPSLCIKRNLQSANESVSILKTVYAHLLKFTASDSVKNVLKYTKKYVYIVTSDLSSSYADTLRLLKELQVVIEDHLSSAEKVANSSIASSILRSVVQFLRTEVSYDALEAHDVSKGNPCHVSGDADSAEDALMKSCDCAIELVLRSAQGVLGRRPEDSDTPDALSSRDMPSNSDDELDIHDGVLAEGHNLIWKSSRISGLSKLKDSLMEICSQTCETRTSNRASLGLRSLAKFVVCYLNSFAIPFVRSAAMSHLQSLALLKTLISIFIGISENGYCRRPDETQELEDDTLPSTVDGAGFGEIDDGDASMAQDVSAEVEDEEQLLGMRNEDKTEEEKNTPNDNQDTDTGVEMETDFEGELQNMDRPDPNDQNEDETENMNDIEEAMGHEPDDAAIDIDEKLWDANDEQSGNANSQPETDQDEVNLGKQDPDSTLVSRDDQNTDHRPKPQSEKKDKMNIEPDEILNDSGADDESHVSQDNDQNVAEAEASDSESMEQKSKRNTPKLPEDDCSIDGSESPDADDIRDCESENKLDDSEQQNANHDSGQADDDCLQIDGEEDADIENPMSGIGTEADETDCQDGNNDDLQKGTDPDFGGLSEDALDNLEDAAIEDNPETLEVPDDEANDDEMKDSERHDLQPEDHKNNASHEDTLEDATLDEAYTEKKEAQGSVPEQINESQNDVASTIGTNTTPWTNANDTFDSSALIFSNPDSSGRPHGTNGEAEADDAAHASGSGESGNAAPSLDQSTSKIQQANDMMSIEQFDPAAGSHDANPFRSVQDEDLGDQWERRLNVLDDSTVKPEDRLDSNEQEDHNMNESEGLYEYTSELDKKTNDKNALGPATNEQHRSLQKTSSENTEIEDSVMEARDDHEISDSQKEQSTQQGPSQLSAKTNSKVGEHPAPSEEIALDAQESTAEELKAHPLVTAMRLLEDMHISGNIKDYVPISDRLEPVNDREDGVQNDQRLDRTPPFDVDPIGVSSSKEGKQTANFVEMWRKLERLVESEAAALCEQLRLVLDPTVRAGLSGPFKTGKRLDMKKVIDFVASDFRRDKIWLRRVRPTKRSYDVLIAIDNSESMSESGAGALALAGLVLLTTALGKLEIGQIGIIRFGADCHVVRGLGDSSVVDENQGSQILSQFSFSEKQTNLLQLLLTSQNILRMSRGSSSEEDLQLLFIISDGKLSDREEIRRRLRYLTSDNVLVAFIVVNSNATENSNIFRVKQVTYGDRGEVQVSPYMSDFPFQFYTVIHDVRLLPSVLGNALRQWLELMSPRNY